MAGGSINSAKGGSVRLFLQGGLGNQLIQQAYAATVAKHYDCRVKLNTILLNRHIAKVRKVWHRNIAFENLIETNIERQRRRVIGSGVDLLFCLATRNKRIINDRVGHRELINRLSACKKAGSLNLLGYFHRSEAFGLDSESYWKRLADGLSDMLDERFPHEDEIAIHARRGDYLTEKNRKIYEQVSIVSQIENAINIREEIDSKRKVRIYTDSPKLVYKEIPAKLHDDVIMHEKTDGSKDFISLSHHKYIICSNSTYSLVAARISHSIWNQRTIHVIPDRWYVDNNMNNAQMSEWSLLTFAEPRMLTIESAAIGNSS